MIGGGGRGRWKAAGISSHGFGSACSRADRPWSAEPHGQRRGIGNGADKNHDTVAGVGPFPAEREILAHGGSIRQMDCSAAALGADAVTRRGDEKYNMRPGSRTG